MKKRIVNNNLSEFEKFVLFEKGTEPPFTGEYENHFEKGIYVCKNCGIPLYNSNDKFHSGCGWPAFDDEIPGAVRKQLDRDGKRTEIVCAYCGAHLGHVFYGEGFTPKNVRHCVNSVSMKFIPEGQKPPIDRMFFAGGCFWGVEHLFKQLDGVVDTRVGYMGGHRKNPTYEQVCTGLTGHYETVEVIFDPLKIDEETLVKYFFEIHDFTQENGQGPDIGEQYKSVIFYTNEKQKEVAEKIKDELSKKYKVATQIKKASDFWLAEDYHQDYYEKTGKAPYCHYRRKIF
ncbi:bifunctional methionine sulfoxide reductase B/A protein [Fervidobacterium sp. 2310opik-2]|uniref:bifunctional methionine sulfoxide reductase B/A protein n=1 Tax=Fervidobacterium sp. 2310opik-2 TaxID=1755815 RepID=UPI000C0260A2|nr:bifunctional methionine sulfoxide reductase B/A protein [Fervidobacterium sp. 2310opik-2]KAF2961724.1 methionine sulfoxide reductase [Fervidobacterium sp. 2310opik-2]PHJ13552.1 methionine sulfoxide reductase [Fervidobacterium sp. SC_NGM5_G05]